MWVIIFGAVTMAYVLLVLWYRWAWIKLPAYQGPASSWEPVTPLTIIIPARNEAVNIDACLRSIVAQQYPHHLLQVLVMDDASEDDTAEHVLLWSNQYPFVKCVSLQVDAFAAAHKKRAIEKGISMAGGKLIVCTDADCTHHPQWLRTLAHRFEQGDVQFIAAPVVYQTASNVLSVFQTLDFMTLQGITGASVSQRFHTMCNGANIAYTKKAFEEVNGFAGIDALPTGDDMLLMYKIYNRYPEGVVWLKSAPATVTTQACSTWSSFFQQRIRWASKAAYYDDKRMFWVLVLVYVFNVIIAGALLMSIFFPVLLLPALSMLLVKTTVEWYFLQPVASFFGKEKWMGWFPILQLHHVAYTVVAGWLGRFGSYQWKGRIVATKKPASAAGYEVKS